MFSNEAIPALTSETRGQNSWLNYGPHGERNRTALGKDTIFADQKTGLLPSWAWEDYSEGGRVDPLDLSVDPLDLSSEEEMEGGDSWIARLRSRGAKEQPRRGPREIEYDRLNTLFGSPSMDAGNIAREHTLKTGDEGLLWGDRAWLSPLTKGDQSGVGVPRELRRFVFGTNDPFFSLHTHPVYYGSLKADGEPIPASRKETTRMMNAGEVTPSFHPSTDDLQMLSTHEPRRHTMMIEGAGVPHVRMAIRPFDSDEPDRVLTNAKSFLSTRQAERQMYDLLKRTADFNSGNGLHPMDEAAYSMIASKKLADIGLPIAIDERAATAGPRIPMHELLKDYEKYLKRHRVSPFAQGGVVHAAV